MDAVLATANELFEARHYPSVVALLSDALDDEPEDVALLLLRARAHIALRRDLEAQADLRDIIRLDPQNGVAYRLLGELAARRDENESAAIFFREALRLDSGDQEAAEWLRIVDRHLTSRPAAAAQKLPAPAAAAGRFPAAPGQRSERSGLWAGARGPIERAQTGGSRSLSSPARVENRPGSQPRFARGTRPPAEDERPTLRRQGTDVPTGKFERPRLAAGSEPSITPIPQVEPLARVEPTTLQGARPSRRSFARPSVPELPGFGEYLVEAGILSRERLRAAQAYQRSMRVQLSTAIVTLGLATPQRIEWAAVAHQAQVGER
ncbi:MAG TPA: hypothetical protein VMJ10_01505 [Kofleriaceae bacterium]|nr:hypothetical protein [Kofleriaceae bacterium]